MADGTMAFGRVWARVIPAREADWDALYSEQLLRVYNFFRYRVGPGPVAEDLTSITFEKAWRARHRYRRDLGAFTTWLLTIARNVAVDHYRQRREQVSLDDVELRTDTTPESDAERRSDLERLAGLLANVPARERELLALKYGAGLTNRAIARLVGLGESNVGTLLHRTIVALRTEWERTERSGDVLAAPTDKEHQRG